jgi:type IV secretory pathway VirB9-like protein
MLRTVYRHPLRGSFWLLLFLVAAPLLLNATDGARVVTYSKEQIIPVRAKLRFSTLIVLPDNEEILDFTTGDKEFWIINGAHNLCYVHPAKAGIRSNLNLVTANGNVYSFLLTEISNEPSVQPDLKLFVEPKEASGSVNLTGYVRASEAEAYRKEIESLRTESQQQLETARTQAVQEIERFRAKYATTLRFDFSFDKKAVEPPFLLSAIYHDERFTYIRLDAHEKPALYELKDGKPNLVNFQFENGTYVVPKLLDSGYLAIGKKKVTFSRHAATR